MTERPARGITSRRGGAGRRTSRYNQTMTVQQLDNVHQAKPFRPFTVHMGDGRSFRVPHPEFLSRSPTGRTMIVYGGDDENFSVLDLLLLTKLEVHPPTVKPGEAA